MDLSGTPVYVFASGNIICRSPTLTQTRREVSHLHNPEAHSCTALLGAKELTQLGSGSWFGEMALIDDAMASAQVRAATPLAVLAIKHDDFQHLLDTHPDMAIQFYRHFAAEMARRLRASNERSE